jgi:hypothetical protein
MNQKGQGALEYLLLLGGAVLVAAIVLSLVTAIASTGEKAALSRAGDAICAPLPEDQCGTKDPDGIDGDLEPDSCEKLQDTTGRFRKCVASNT